MAARRKRTDRPAGRPQTKPLGSAADHARPVTFRRSSRSGTASGAMIFGRSNYMLLLSALGLIVLGYVILAIDNQIRSIPSLYIAPTILTAGYLLVIGAILHRPKKTASSEESQSVNR